MEGSKPFIVVEGQNKSGKGTIADFIKDKLEAKGIEATTIREPGGTDIGEAIRAVLLNSELERPAITDLLLFNAARAATVDKIQQLLKSKSVVSDRSYLSTLAFQMHGDGADEEVTRAICRTAIGDNYNPDIYLLLDIDYTTYLERANKELDPEDDYFERDKNYFNRVREGYLYEARQIGAVVIDAARPLEEVKQTVWQNVEEVL